MRLLTIAIATVATTALTAPVPASAQQHQHGGPVQAGNQCWKHHGAPDYRFGHFEACPQPASNLAPSRATRRRT